MLGELLRALLGMLAALAMTALFVTGLLLVRDAADQVAVLRGPSGTLAAGEAVAGLLLMAIALWTFPRVATPAAWPNFLRQPDPSQAMSTKTLRTLLALQVGAVIVAVLGLGVHRTYTAVERFEDGTTEVDLWRFGTGLLVLALGLAAAPRAFRTFAHPAPGSLLDVSEEDPPLNS